MDDLLALASEPEATEGDAEASTDIKANINNKAHMGSKAATDNKAHMESKAATDNKAHVGSKAATDKDANGESSSEDDVDMDSSEDDDGGSEDIPRHNDSSANPSALFFAISFKVFFTILDLFFY